MPDTPEESGGGAADACRKCGGEMREGRALQNTVSRGVSDFPGARDVAGQTFSFTGPPVLVKVLKCSACGHSRSLRAADTRTEGEGER
jgi:hypothetical protein